MRVPVFIGAFILDSVVEHFCDRFRRHEVHAEPVPEAAFFVVAEKDIGIQVRFVQNLDVFIGADIISPIAVIPELDSAAEAPRLCGFVKSRQPENGDAPEFQERTTRNECYIALIIRRVLQPAVLTGRTDDCFFGGKRKVIVAVHKVVTGGESGIPQCDGAIVMPFRAGAGGIGDPLFQGKVFELDRAGPDVHECPFCIDVGDIFRYARLDESVAVRCQEGTDLFDDPVGIFQGFLVAFLGEGLGDGCPGGESDIAGEVDVL